jgi:hypothetical protein
MTTILLTFCGLIIILVGYYTWAKPVIQYMKKSRIFTNCVNAIAKPWSYERAHIMGKRENGDFIGKVIMYFGFIICLLIGVIITNTFNINYLLLLLAGSILFIKWRKYTIRKCLILTTVLLFLLGCNNTIIAKYNYKERDGLVDKKVEIRQIKDRTKGQIDIVFSKKQIPFEISIDISKFAYAGIMEVNGSLETGNIKIKLVTMDNEEVRSINCSTGKIKEKTDRFDLYGGLHKLIFEFNDAKEGTIKLNYQIALL